MPSSIRSEKSAPQARYAPPKRYTPREQSEADAHPHQRARSMRQERSGQLSQPQSSRSQILRPQPSRPRRKRHYKRIAIRILVLLIVAAIALPTAWGIYLYRYGNARLTHVDALSSQTSTAGATYLIVGSDERAPDSPDPTEGMRADTIMLLHKPPTGKAALVSLPRDSWVAIPENGSAKINAAFSWGGPQLLVQTVESLTGLTVDHYIQIGMDGVKELTEAVDGISLCYEADVDDPESQMKWLVEGSLSFPATNNPAEQTTLTFHQGCADNVRGDQALAFSRMRKADPMGDIGRTLRQRQVVGAVLKKALTKEILLSPAKQKNLVGGASSAMTVDRDSSIADIALAGLALRDVMGEDGLLGTPPIASVNYWTPDGQSAVQLDPQAIEDFWEKFAQGTLRPEDFYQPPTLQ